MRNIAYLHNNGDVIFKKDLDGICADMRESDLVVMFWFVDDESRADAWDFIVELSAIAKTEQTKKRIKELSEKWGCDNEDAKEYAKRIGVVLGKDGDQKTATKKDFTNLQESPCGFGNNYLEAMADLCKQLGFAPMKLQWHARFKDLVKEV